MKKMPCLFERTFHSKSAFEIHDRVTPGCEWVLAGEGTPTVKFDGTACAVIHGELYKRYDAKRGKTAPPGAIPCDEPDPVTGHHPHWIRVGDEPESKHHRAAWEECSAKRMSGWTDGTYELCGPKFQGNPHGISEPVFYAHGSVGVNLERSQRSFEGLKAFLETFEYEGIVFHHRDGRMCKIRRSDFGFPWPIPKAAAP